MSPPTPAPTLEICPHTVPNMTIYGNPNHYQFCQVREMPFLIPVLILFVGFVGSEIFRALDKDKRRIIELVRELRYFLKQDKNSSYTHELEPIAYEIEAAEEKSPLNPNKTVYTSLDRFLTDTSTKYNINNGIQSYYQNIGNKNPKDRDKKLRSVLNNELHAKVAVALFTVQILLRKTTAP
ncbi:MAG: hypothetical protein ACTSUE_15175, partial [Promethearchaeota archaeon]